MDIISLVISIISLLFAAITIIWSLLDRTNRILKYRICKFIYRYYAPCYMVNDLPSSNDIFKRFNKLNKENRNARLQYLLIELSHEKMIEMVTDLSSSFEQSKWKPNVIIHGKK